jgi:hypothetical protein
MEDEPPTAEELKFDCVMMSSLNGFVADSDDYLARSRSDLLIFPLAQLPGIP